MLDNNTATKLREMKLGVMASSFLKQIKDNSVPALSFEERFGLLVDVNAEKKMHKNAEEKMHKRGDRASVQTAQIGSDGPSLTQPLKTMS